MSFESKVLLNSGQSIPTLGYGTWKSSPGEVSIGVYEALKTGYENQRDVAQGIKKAFETIPGLKREDLFVTSKLWNNSHSPEDVEKALDETLEELGLEYLDLYLIHWPVAFEKSDNKELSPLHENGQEVAIENSVSLVETWKAMIKLPKSKLRAIGVSNFAPEHIDAIVKATGVTPAVNQVERHPLLQQKETLVKFCMERNIHITAYSAFGNNNVGAPLLLEHPIIKDVAAGLSATPAQVLLAWAQVGGHSVIPKSVTPSRIQSNYQEIKLSETDIAKIDGIGSTPRRYNIPTTCEYKKSYLCDQS
ncbi:unnamed protein product [Penicillium salamii]|nr:unnamed protein product [Penicillium salamii]